MCDHCQGARDLNGGYVNLLSGKRAETGLMLPIVDASGYVYVVQDRSFQAVMQQPTAGGRRRSCFDFRRGNWGRSSGLPIDARF